MGELWFTADLHLGHGGVIQYCNRPFLSDEEQQKRRQEGSRRGWTVSRETIDRHDTALIDAINERVRPQDTLWVLGDFCLSPVEVAAAYRERIHCRQVHLVKGNHDRASYARLFSRVIDQGMIKHQGQKIWLNHYPMKSWDKAYHGAWHLYGHVHGRLQAEEAAAPWVLSRDVGVDTTGYAPISFPELAVWMEPRVRCFREWKEKLGGEAEEGWPPLSHPPGSDF